MTTNPTLTRLIGGYGLLEAARWTSEHGLIFSDMNDGGVHRLRPGATDAEVLIPHRKAIGGLVPHAEGGLVISGRNIARKVIGGETQSLHELVEDEQFFNDLTADWRGRVFAGSMPKHGTDGCGRLYMIDLDGSVTTVTEDVRIANGFGASPDDDLLYQVDSGRYLVWRFALPASGPPTGRELFVDTSEYDGLPDGLAVAADGSIWVAIAGASCVVAWDTAGNRIAEIPVPSALVTSVAFGGPDHDQLFILTGTDDEHPHPDGGEVYVMPAPTKGLPSPLARVRVPPHSV